MVRSRSLSSIALLSLLTVAACADVDVDGYGEPFDSKSEAIQPPPPDLTNHDCHFVQMYINNQQEPTTVPWSYCICAVRPANDPISWDMGGGYWTYPWGACQTNYGTY